ncbi:MAG: hypothetical protein E6H84_10610 [Chloroflexi bacterium]|nr:MAG: hypothetical protein E6H84_10610 [Chloroflexota bacterium]
MEATPLAPTLKPLGVGDVLDRTFNLYKQRPLLFIALSAIWYLLLVIVFVVLAIAVFAGAIASFVRESPTDIDPATLAGAISGFIAFLIVGILVAILLFSAQSASLIRAGALRYLGKEANVGEAFGSGVRASPRVFLAGVLAFVLIALFWAAAFIVAALIGAITQSGGLTFVAIFLAVCVALVGTFYLTASWLVAPIVIVVEGLGPIAALSRAWGLSSGNRWRIIGIQALLALLNVVLSALISAVFAIGGQADQGTTIVIQNLANFASTIVWAPVEWLAFTVLYYDLRVRKEAFDLQLAAEALPPS